MPDRAKIYREEHEEHGGHEVVEKFYEVFFVLFVSFVVKLFGGCILDCATFSAISMVKPRAILFQGCRSFSITLAPDRWDFFRLAEMQAVRGADRCACGFQSSVNTILAEITLDHFACFRIPLRRPPGTRGHAALTPHAEAIFHKDDAVLFPLLHGSGRAGSHAPRVLTVEAGHESIGSSR